MMGVENSGAAILLLLIFFSFLIFKKYTGDLLIGSLLYLRDSTPQQWFVSFNMQYIRERWIYALLIALAAGIAMGPVKLTPTDNLLLVLDNSVSMMARMNRDLTRFDKAKQWLLMQGKDAIEQGKKVVVMPLIAENSVELRAVSTYLELADDIDRIATQWLVADAAQYLPLVVATANNMKIGKIVFATDQPLDGKVVDDFVWQNVLDVEKSTGFVNLGFVKVNQPAALYEPPRQTEVVLRNFSSHDVTDISLHYRFSVEKDSDKGAPRLLEPFKLPAYGERRFTLDELIASDDDHPGNDRKDRPFLLSIHHSQDAFDADNQLWIVPENRQKFVVKLLSCREDQDTGPLWKRIFPHPAMQIIKNKKDGEQTAWDLIISDSCSDQPELDDIPTNFIFISPKKGAFSAVQSVEWQGNWIGNPLLMGVKPLFGMTLHRPNSIQIPENYAKLFPLFSQYQFQIGQKKEEKHSSLKETTLAGIMKNGNRFLYLGFDAHHDCDSKIQGGGAFRNDDCLSMVLLLINTLQWMLPYTVNQQYYPIGQLYRGGNHTRQSLVYGQKALEHQACDDGGSVVHPLQGSAFHQWSLGKSGIYRYCDGARSNPQFVSVSILNAEASKLEKVPFSFPVGWEGLRTIGKDKNSLVHHFLVLLAVLMVAESWLLVRRLRNGNV